MSNEKKFDMVAFNGMMEAVTTVSQAMSTIVGEVSGIKTEMSKMRNDIDFLKDNAEITNAQRGYIRKVARNRVYTLLGLPLRKADMSEADKIVAVKYLSMFFNRCYSETSNLGHLNIPIGTTPKKNYDDAIRDLEAWTPSNGINGLKSEADEAARIRRMVNG